MVRDVKKDFSQTIATFTKNTFFGVAVFFYFAGFLLFKSFSILDGKRPIQV